MTKQYIVLSVILSFLLSACSKTENVAVDYPFLLDEEFINNEKGWTVTDTSASATKYFQKLVTNGNGLYSTVYFSSFGSPNNGIISYVDVGLNKGKDYILESALTFDNESHSTAVPNGANKPCGIIWDVQNDNNYYKVAAGYSKNDGAGNLYIRKVVSNAVTELITPIELDLSSPTVNLKINKTTQENNLNTIEVFVNGQLAATVDSLTFNGSGSVGIHSDKGTAINYHYLRVRQEP